MREKPGVNADDCREDAGAAGGTDAIELKRDEDCRQRHSDSVDVEQEHIRRENRPTSREGLAQQDGGRHGVSGHRNGRPVVEQLGERNAVSKSDGSCSHNRPSHVLPRRTQGGYDHSGTNAHSDRDGEVRRSRGGGFGLVETSGDEHDCGDRRRADSKYGGERDSRAGSGEGSGCRSGYRNDDSRRSDKGRQRGDEFGRERRSDDHRERDSLDERRDRSLDRREDSAGDCSSAGDEKRESRDKFGRETQSAAGDAVTGRGPVESRLTRPVNSHDRGRDDSREQRRYGRGRVIADSGRGFAGGGSRSGHARKDRVEDSTRDRTRDRSGDRFRKGDRRDVGNDPRDLGNGGGGGDTLDGGRSGDSRQRGDFDGERRSNDQRRRDSRDSRDRNGYRDDRLRRAESWTGGGDRESSRRNYGDSNRRDWTRDGRNSQGSRQNWSARDSRERRSPPVDRNFRAREPNASFRTRDNFRAPSPCTTIGIRDGQWVGSGMHVRSAGASGRDDDGPENNRANRGGAPDHAAGAQSTPVMMGFVAAGNESAGSTRPAGATAPAAAAAITAKIAAAGGDMPRRPRWDKAGPGASAAVCNSTEPGKAGEPTRKKKLVWGSGSGATGGGGDGIAGKKRALWAAGAGGEAARIASTEAQGAAAAGVGDVSVGNGMRLSHFSFRSSKYCKRTK